jgi:hypothetical protein
MENKIKVALEGENLEALSDVTFMLVCVATGNDVDKRVFVGVEIDSDKREKVGCLIAINYESLNRCDDKEFKKLVLQLKKALMNDANATTNI